MHDFAKSEERGILKGACGRVEGSVSESDPNAAGQLRREVLQAGAVIAQSARLGAGDPLRRQSIAGRHAVQPRASSA